MANRFRPVVRDQQFLMPENMADWLPDDDPVWLVIDVVEQLHTRVHLEQPGGGRGRAAYDPVMMLTVLIWAWSHGVRSSREIERLCRRDISYRVICGVGNEPDHVTIARFRRSCNDAIEELFAGSLAMCGRLGLGRVGVIAIDGTKIASDASLGANRGRDAIEEALRVEAQKASAEHARLDDVEDDEHGPTSSGDRIPGTLTDRSSRLARLRAADASVRAQHEARDAEQKAADERVSERERVADERARERADEVARQRRDYVPASTKGKPLPENDVLFARLRVEYWRRVQQAKIDHYEAKLADPNRVAAGQRPYPVDQAHRVKRAEKGLAEAMARQAVRDEKAAGEQQARERAERDRRVRMAERMRNTPVSEPRCNITDPESGLMPLRGGGWLQGYNAFVANCADDVILGYGVSNSSSDAPMWRPVLDRAVRGAQVLADHRPDDPRWDSVDDRIGVALGDAGFFSLENLTADGPDRLIAPDKAHKVDRAARDAPTDGPVPDGADPYQANAHRLATPVGHALYKQRSGIVEKVFGQAKENMKFRRFTGRGRVIAEAEWGFHCAVHNLMKVVTVMASGRATA